VLLSVQFSGGGCGSLRASFMSANGTQEDLMLICDDSDSNIFNPYDQKDLVNAITNFYGFSPRLAKVITTAPASRRRIRAVSPRPSLRMRHRFLGRLSGESRELRDRDPEIAINVHAPAGQFLSVEQTAEALEMAARVAVGPGLGGGGGKMNYMNLVQKVWHFHAVEWGGRCKFRCPEGS
jgi:hypothetical protein